MGEEKKVKFNLVFDVSRVDPEMLRKKPTNEEVAEFRKEVSAWEALPKENRPERPALKEEYSPAAEVTGQICLEAIRMVKPTGNVQLLRKTKRISDLFETAVKESLTEVDMLEDDFRYINSAVSKADKWNNVESVANLVIEIMGLIDKTREQL